MEEIEINEGHYFEIMDRAHVIMCNIDEHLAKHPAMTDEQRKKLEDAQGYIVDVYQWAGEKMYEMEEAKSI